MSRDHEYHFLTVTDVVDETDDTRSFVLEVPSGLAEGFRYQAGQFCTFRRTIDGESVVRCYSMSSSPETGDPFTVTVKRVEGGKMSNWMNDALVPGAVLEVMPPTGLFVLRDTALPLVAFAGGSGITPIISIIRTALATTQRQIALVYANRNAESVIFADALEKLRASSGGRLSIHHHLDSESGFLDGPACAALVGDHVDADFYVCGPGPFMDAVEAGLGRRGVDAAQVHIERFEMDAATLADEEASVTKSVVIRLDRRKETVPYEPGDTILDCARRAGLKPPFSCVAGNCATCMAFVGEGKVRMRVNNALSLDEVEEGWVLTCQALPLSEEVVVDFDH